MKKIFLRDAEDNEIMPDLVRYFKYQSGGCLIYTFREIDENNFMTLYAVKVLEELGVFVSKYTFNDWEWGNVRTTMQTMLTEIKNHEESSFEDLDVNAIQGMRIIEARRFKILADLIDEFSGCPDEGEQKIISPKDTKPIATSHTQIQNPKLVDLNQLKEKYRIKEDHKILAHENILMNYDIPPIVELNKPIIEVETPTVEEKEVIKKHLFHSSPTAKKVVDTTITVEKYRQLQKENELLKQQLVQYQKKYQAILELLNKDE